MEEENCTLKRYSEQEKSLENKNMLSEIKISKEILKYKIEEISQIRTN